ncbi:ERF family protein [Oceanobacillus indicireducens]|uniref:Recombinase n=1 Tax=Oceanobacillus indicireducens TaxID=1004261 RepID=A0A917Y4P4_9BACI|nr:ERF family protein [Oceanobacillus indicireducens]GGN66355.1 hypothetical protein GCM10007971_36200 [Oceanobacillus indicireducens]
MTSLTEKLIHIQKELKAPKGNWNKFSSFYYRSAEDILEAVKPLNAEQGLLLTLSDEPVLIGEWHYIKATASISDGKENHEVTAYARESEIKKGMDSSQITGTASSYARKYALNGLYLIDDTKDADTDQYHNQNNVAQNTQQNNQITQQQVGQLKAKAMQFAQARNQTEQAVYEVLKISDITQLNRAQAASAIKQLDIWLDGVKKEQANG